MESVFVVSYYYETSYLGFREEPRLRVFENEVIRRIFVPEKDKITD